MTQTRTIRARTGATIAAVGVAALVAACGSSHASTPSSASSGSNASSASAVSATPASDHALRLSIVSGKNGRHLAGAGGRAIYLWEADGHNMSHCSGACAQAWPPLLTKSKPAAGSGVKSSDLGTIAHKGAEKQVTYNGHPLYYFAGDSGRGTTAGQGSDGFGAKWWLVNPSGAAITHSASSGSSGSGYSGSGSGTPSTTTTSSSSSAGGSSWG